MDSADRDEYSKYWKQAVTAHVRLVRVRGLRRRRAAGEQPAAVPQRRAAAPGAAEPTTMVGLVIVSHSAALAEGVVALAREMGGEEVAIEAAGGMEDGADRHRRRAGPGCDRARRAATTACSC